MSEFRSKIFNSSLIFTTAPTWHGYCDQGMSKYEMKSVLLLGQIMFYSRIFKFQAQLGTRDIQKLDSEKVVFTSKKAKMYIFDMLPEQSIMPCCDLMKKRF